MKHLIFTALFLLSYTVAVRAQIVFPTPNQVEMQTGNLILGKKVLCTPKTLPLFI